MDERWQKVERLYHSALEIAPAQRGDFLAAACEGDKGLRREVESLLAQGGSTGALFGQGAEDLPEGLSATRTIMTAAAKIGPYEIRGPLGAAAWA